MAKITVEQVNGAIEGLGRAVQIARANSQRYSKAALHLEQTLRELRSVTDAEYETAFGLETRIATATLSNNLTARVYHHNWIARNAEDISADLQERIDEGEFD